MSVGGGVGGRRVEGGHTGVVDDPNDSRMHCRHCASRVRRLSLLPGHRGHIALKPLYGVLRTPYTVAYAEISGLGYVPLHSAQNQAGDQLTSKPSSSPLPFSACTSFSLKCLGELGHLLHSICTRPNAYSHPPTSKCGIFCAAPGPPRTTP